MKAVYNVPQTEAQAIIADLKEYQKSLVAAQEVGSEILVQMIQAEMNKLRHELLGTKPAQVKIKPTEDFEWFEDCEEVA